MGNMEYQLTVQTSSLEFSVLFLMYNENSLHDESKCRVF